MKSIVEEEKKNDVAAGLPEADGEVREEEKALQASDAGAAEAGEAEGSSQAGDGTENEEEKWTPPPAVKSSRKLSGELMFENQITINRDLYLEFVKTIMRPYRRVYYVIAAISLVLGLYLLLCGAVSSSMTFFFVAVICLFLQDFMYRSQRNQKFNRQVEKNGGKPLERRALFYEDGLEIFSNSSGHTVYGYEDITRVAASKSIYVITLQKQISVLVLKDGFVKGNPEDWKAFMATKGKWKIR